VRRLFAVSILLVVCALGTSATGASAAAKHKSCGTVTPKSPPNSGGGARAFKVTIVKGRVKCSTAQTVFRGLYVDSKITMKNGKALRTFDGFTCAGSPPPYIVVTCTRQKVKIKGQGV
jgi:hypothetical protein